MAFNRIPNQQSPNLRRQPLLLLDIHFINIFSNIAHTSVSRRLLYNLATGIRRISLTTVV